MNENPFINYWLWYYDVLWYYWPIVVLLMIIAVWLINRHFAKRESLHEASNVIKVDQEDKDGWHKASDIPCPGSLIVCENVRHQLHFGYAVAHDGKACLLHIPNWLQDYRKVRGSVELKTITPIPVFMFERWQYIERRILPTETLVTYEQMYQR